MKVADGKVTLYKGKKRLLLNVETSRLRGPAELTPAQAYRLAYKLGRWAWSVGYRDDASR